MTKLTSGTVVVSKTVVVCPHCEEVTRLGVDHLKGRDTVTSWTCSLCGHEIGIESKAGEIIVTKRDTPQQIKGLSLLRFPGSNTYFVFSGPVRKYDDEETRQSGDAFFFEENSCPTNWIKRCVAVISDGDTDPHGFLEFVRSTPGVNGVWGNETHDDWIEIFPEAFTAEQRAKA